MMWLHDIERFKQEESNAGDAEVSDRILKPRSFEELEWVSKNVFREYYMKVFAYQKELSKLEEQSLDGEDALKRLKEVMEDYCNSVYDILIHFDR